MKAEHRHQLQTNVLADKLGRLLQGLKSSPRSGRIVWGLVIGVIVVVVGWQYWSASSRKAHSALWANLSIATHDPLQSVENITTELQSLSDNNPGTAAGRAAAFQIARMRLLSGQEAMVTVRDTKAVDDLKSALKDYERLEGQCSDAPALHQEALMAVAKAKESLIGVKAGDGETGFGSVADALSAYQKLADRYPNSKLGQAAKTRADELKSQGDEIEKFYTELNQPRVSKPLTLPPIPDPTSAK